MCGASEDQVVEAAGRFRIYLGAAAGVGKTYAMLNEGHRRKERGADVVIGFVETHDRQHTKDMIGDLEVVPRKAVEYRGSPLEEMDLDAILRRHRRPQRRAFRVDAPGTPTGRRGNEGWSGGDSRPAPADIVHPGGGGPAADITHDAGPAPGKRRDPVRQTQLPPQGAAR